MQSADSFESVATLETPALRELFEHGRPEQRVWAIWALALRTGGLVAVDRAARDPDPGVRRTMAVMLAGHGEHDLLVALARHDPSKLVRESAMQIVTRLASQGALDGRVVIEASREDRAVRGAILAAIDRGAPQFLVDIACELLREGDASEQGDAFEALMRTEAHDVVRSALAWLVALPEARARDACTRLVRLVGEYAFAAELARGSLALRRIALGVLYRPQWSTVEMLVGDDAELLLEIVRRGQIEVPIAALARAALDGYAAPFVERLRSDLAIIDAPSEELRRLLPLLDTHYAQWIETLERELASLPDVPMQLADDDDDDEAAEDLQVRASALDNLIELQRQIQRLRER